MRDRFDVEAKLVLDRAREEAIRFNHEQIRTEHILLALLSDVRIRDLLFRLGMTKTDVRSAIEREIVKGPRLVIDVVEMRTEEVRDVIDSTLEEVDGFGHTMVRSGHLLLGLLKASDGVARKVLEGFGTTLDGARHEVLEFLADLDAEEPGAA